MKIWMLCIALGVMIQKHLQLLGVFCLDKANSGMSILTTADYLFVSHVGKATDVAEKPKSLLPKRPKFSIGDMTSKTFLSQRSTSSNPIIHSCFRCTIIQWRSRTAKAVLYSCSPRCMSAGFSCTNWAGAVRTGSRKMSR